MKMARSQQAEQKLQLPPLWVKLFSWCFAYLMILPLMMFPQLALGAGHWGLSAYGFSIEEGNASATFSFFLTCAIFFGSLTGIAILTKRTYAYDFGIFYCVFTLALIATAPFLQKHPLEDGGLQGGLVAFFLIHLIRHRNLWRKWSATQRS